MSNAEEPDGQQAGETARPAPRIHNTRLRLALCLLALLASPLVLELALRTALFSDQDWIAKRCARFRDPGLYALPLYDPEYWKLNYRLGEAHKDEPTFSHPKLGWVSQLVKADTLRHRQDKQLGQRRPILFYGASYGKGMPGSGPSFAELVDASPFGDTHCLLNFSATGYGLGQAVESFEGSIEHYAHRNPLIVFVLLVQSDFGRVSFGLRGFAKPSYGLKPGSKTQRLEIQAPAASTAEQLERDPLNIRSYALRYLTFGLQWLPEAWVTSPQDKRDLDAERRLVWKLLLERVQQETKRRDLDCVFLLCAKQKSIEATPKIDWREKFLIRTMTRLKLRHVNLRTRFQAYADDHKLPLEELFLHGVPAENHPSEAGNQVILEAVMKCLSKS